MLSSGEDARFIARRHDTLATELVRNGVIRPSFLVLVSTFDLVVYAVYEL